MVLAVLFLFFNVYIFMQNQDTKFQDAISQSQQLDADRNAEHLTIASNQPLIIVGNEVIANCSIANNGSLPLKIMREWLIDSITNAGNCTSSTIVLAPGESQSQLILNFWLPVSSGHYRLELVTSRGNLISTNIS